MDWWRAHHGIATDPKYAVVMRHIASHCVTVGHVTSRAEIVAVWVWLLDFSSQNQPRGSVADLDVAQIAVTLDVPDEIVLIIVEAFRTLGMIESNLLKAWGKRQPSREDSSAERTRRYREHSKKSVTQCDAPVTQCDAEKREVTNGDDRARARAISSVSSSFSISGNTTSNGGLKPSKNKTTEFPVCEVVAACFDKHEKRDKFENRDSVVAVVSGMEIDHMAMSIAHAKLCEHWKGRWRYNSETFLAWVRNGMPVPTPDEISANGRPSEPEKPKVCRTCKVSPCSCYNTYLAAQGVV